MFRAIHDGTAIDGFVFRSGGYLLDFLVGRRIQQVLQIAEVAFVSEFFQGVMFLQDSENRFPLLAGFGLCRDDRVILEHQIKPHRTVAFEAVTHTPVDIQQHVGVDVPIGGHMAQDDRMVGNAERFGRVGYR